MPSRSGRPCGIAHLVGEDQNGVDDAPDDGAEAAGDQADDELGDAQPGVAEVDAADADEAEQPEQLQQSGDDLGFVGQRLAGQRMTAVRRGGIRVRRRVIWPDTGGGYCPAGMARRVTRAAAEAAALPPSLPLNCGSVMAPSMPEAQRNQPAATSSVHTLKLVNVLAPNALLSATSAASRPRAISTLPMRGMLLRASKVCHCPPRYTSNQAAKSIGPYGGGMPMSPR